MYKRQGGIRDKIKDALKKFASSFENLRNIKFERKMLSIVIAIVALLGVGSLTGYTVMVLNQKEDEIASLTSKLNYCNATLEECNIKNAELTDSLSSCRSEVSSLTSDLSSCESEKSEYISSLNECEGEKQSLSQELETYKTTTEELQTKYESLSEKLKAVSENFAKSKCCPDYEYYALIDNNVLCCYRSGETYICGPGHEVEEVEPLAC